MGEPRKVEVELVDLKVLVDAMFEKDVRRRAEIIVLNQPGHSDPQVAFEFDRLVGEADRKHAPRWDYAIAVSAKH